MKVFRKLRLYHALLAFSALAAYATGGIVSVHPWIGNDDEDEAWLLGLHEFSANMMLIFVGLYVPYMVLFRRPLAGYMLFRPARKQRIA